jgi:hypothetical protein
MMLPAHFWANTQYCPDFPISKVQWDNIHVTAVAGVSLPKTHNASEAK